MIRKSLALKLTLLVLLFSSMIVGAVIANNYFFSRNLLIEQAEEISHTKGQEIAYQILSLIKPIEQASRNISLALESSVLSEKKLGALSRLIVENNDKLFGLAIAFEPYEKGTEKRYFAPYSSRKDGKVETVQLGSLAYRYFYKVWYQLPQQLGQAIWTEPYYDAGGANAIITSFSVPFYGEKDGKKYFAGVVRADISLDWLQKIISNIKLYQTGYATILSRNGTYIYHPMKELQFNETVFSVAEERNDEELWQIGRDMVSGKTGFLERPSIRDNKESFLLYMPLPIDGWSLAFLFPTNEVLKDANELTRNTLLIGFVGFILFSIAIFIIASRMIKPVNALSRATLEIAEGNLNAHLPPVSSTDEVGTLTQSFRFMQSSLEKYIVELKETTATKERIESELRIARDIQMGILPKVFPPFPNHNEFEIFALLEPAKEVGGDLYDFFFVDENHLCFLIGDVSGKGVPAAFLMAVAKTLLKVIAEQGFEPGEILEKVNNNLAEDNESCMFVTLFLAILDIRTGVVVYGNAGHNPPVFINGNSASFLPAVNEPVAGGMPDMSYTTNKMTLAKGDSLFLYTDGVTEAMNTNMALYSDERLLDYLSSNSFTNVTDMIQAVNSSVTEFAGDTEQSDDITMLALQYKG